MDKLKIGFINLMPNAGEYAELIKRSLDPVREAFTLHPIRLRSHEYRSSQDAVEAYSYFDDLIDQGQLDLLLVTGAPVEHLPYEEIRYWPELNSVFETSSARRIPVMGICFGAMAIAKHLGIEKRLMEDKLFGVYKVPVAPEHRHYLGATCTSLNLSLSTWALLDDSAIPHARKGPLKSIARHPTLGNLMLATKNDEFLMVLGHPEYTIDTLRREWQRDIAKDIPYTRGFESGDFVEMERLLAQGTYPILANWVRSHLEYLNVPA